ncbi:unnamed protein product [Rhizophagus irregularis]|nr:unnamed protein product [Rhizophagus irregularis]
MPSNTSYSWYTMLVAQDPANRYAIQRPNGSWMVIDYSAGLCILNLHNEAKRSISPQKIFLLLKIKIIMLAQDIERLAFHCMLKQYGLESNTTIRTILGLYDPQIIYKLQKLVHKKFPLRYPSIFQCESLENLRNSAKKKEETLLRSLKRGQEEIDNFLCENDSNEKVTSINNEAGNASETDITTLNSAEIQKLVEKEIDEKKLESVIFISTSQYLSILLSLPCSNCHDLIVSNRIFYTKVSGFNISCVITCLLCETITQYSNEDSGVKYSHLVIGAALAGGIYRNSIQTALATIGITNQCSKKSFYNYQARMYKPIIDSAKFSSEMLLREILDHLELTHLPGQEKMLPIGFDCSWSHSRNAHQASGEFLYLGDLPGYNYQPVIGFYTVENSRVIHKSENDSSAIIYKGNFDGTSRKMEHAILLALLNDIMPILEQTDFTLYVCVDGDLETNRTLACIPAVSCIFANLKYVSKNIRKNLLKKQYSRWHPFEQHIMRYFNSCIFSVGLKNKLNQNNNPELQLQNPTLKNYTQAEIENFQSFITTIFHIPSGQELVTTFRTSHNETFNRKILKYLDKRINYWASYSTWHALAVLDQNDGLDVMISKVRTVATEKDFSYSDICNILNFVKKRSQNVFKNHSTIQQRNEARKEKFANDRKELAGFDFDKELVSYKSKTPEQIRKDIFWPSFGDILRDFDVIVKCVACHAFAKKSAHGLCGLCSFYVDAGLWGRIINDKFIPKGQLLEPLKIETLISLAAKKIFGFDNFRDGQMEAIITYLGGKDTFVSMKTGRGKTLCYALSAICFEGLTIVFSPLKALMDDQKRELISASIPCATIYANLAQGASIQEKIFEEIACGLIKILFIMPEKLTSIRGW